MQVEHNFLKVLDIRSNNTVRLFSIDNGKCNLLVEKLKQCPLNTFIVNWYLSFLGQGMQHMVCNEVFGKWKNVHKGTTQGSVTGPYFFNVFLNDLEIDGYRSDNIELNIKYTDDSTLQITVYKDTMDNMEKYPQILYRLDNSQSDEVLHLQI